GGFHHTVDLCPLMSDEGDQRHGECGTFAFVETYAVNGQAWKNVVGKTSDDFRTTWSKAGVKDLTVSMDPVDGENLAGVDESFTAKSAGNLTFDFNRMPAGVYKVTAPSGWIARRGPLESPTNDLAARVSPLDSALNIDVTPTTGYAYGHVVDGENRRMPDVTVNVNGVSVETDSNGRYIAEGFGPRNYRAPGSQTTQRNRIVVTTAEEGSEETTNLGSFAANTPRRINVTIQDAQEVTTISGKVTHSDGGAGVGGVRVNVVGGALLNPNARSSSTLTRNNIYLTSSDGSFSVRTPAKAGGATVAIRVSRDGMFFSPDQHTVSAVAGASLENINFTAFDNGTIHGRVVDARNNPISGVIVTATQVAPGTATDADTTGTTGTYSLSVRYGQYDVAATKHGYTIPGATGINVPNDGKAIDDLVGTPAEDNADLASMSLSGVTLCRSAACPTRDRGFSTGTTMYTARVGNATDMTTVSATPSVPGAEVTEIYPDDADDDASGHQVALDVGTTTIEVTVTAADGETTKAYEVVVTRLDESTTITGTVTDAQSGDGISGVRITPTAGSNLLNSGIRTYVLTNNRGQYTAIFESGGSTVLTPSKTGYTFEPGNRPVELNAGTV
ncbi:MAG: carboxypeptidase regulatory-like domain-containing protein, partial [Rhodococcus sp.]|nr:carboxypeptidase regulatory-like domain-containing protein [Rhodococcus sp. (in: high G+C Gram-positive bacteria)]